MEKSRLSEADICEKFITPAIQQAGWDKGVERVDASTEKHCFVTTFAEPMALCDHIKERLGQARQQNAQLTSVLVKQVVA